MKKGLLILVALSIALLMGASMLVSQEKATAEKEKGSCGKEMKAPGKEMGSCGMEMKLTDEQKAKLEEMKTNFRLKMIDLKAERAKLGILLKQEMMKPEPAMKDIEGIVKKMSAVRENIMLAGIEHMLAMRKILGPDACKGMHGGMGMGCGMMGMQGMSCCDDEEGCMMMGGGGRGMGGERGMPGKRMMMMRMKAPGCDKEEGEGCAAEGMKGGCKMGKNAAAGCAKECAGKEIECKVEVKEVKEEAKKK